MRIFSQSWTVFSNIWLLCSLMNRHLSLVPLIEQLHISLHSLCHVNLDIILKIKIWGKSLHIAHFLCVVEYTYFLEGVWSLETGCVCPPGGEGIFCLHFTVFTGRIAFLQPKFCCVLPVVCDRLCNIYNYMSWQDGINLIEEFCIVSVPTS